MIDDYGWFIDGVRISSHSDNSNNNDKPTSSFSWVKLERKIINKSNNNITSLLYLKLSRPMTPKVIQAYINTHYNSGYSNWSILYCTNVGDIEGDIKLL